MMKIKTVKVAKASTFACRIGKSKRAETVLAALLSLIMILVTSSVAFAGSVSYEGEADGFVFEPGSTSSASDLFEKFNDIMPGDTITDSVDVVNNGTKDAKIYMRALGAGSGEKFLSQLKLTVKQEGTGTLFDATADKTTGLSDWVLLGEFAPGDSETLALTLAVPIELDNEYQDAIGTISWEFKVEEIDEDDPEPEPDPDNDSNPGNGSRKLVKTGDATRIGIFVVILAAAIIALVVMRRKKNK